MLPDYITAYLTDEGIPTDALKDPLTSFKDLGLDMLDIATIANLIEEHTGRDVADEVYERWDTLEDLAQAAAWFEGVVA